MKTKLLWLVGGLTMMALGSGCSVFRVPSEPIPGDMRPLWAADKIREQHEADQAKFEKDLKRAYAGDSQ